MKDKLNSLKKFQKGELEGVLIYKKLEKFAPNQEIAKIFNQLAVDEGRHASIMHSYTNTTVKAGKLKSTLIVPLQKIIGWKLLLKIIAGQEFKGYDNYEPYQGETHYAKTKHLRQRNFF